MEIIEDKKVIVIGNSPSILLKENGEFIDSHDIVIRVNHCPTDGYEKFIGKKIDIWATTKISLYKDRFIPRDFDKLSQIWHRTEKTKRVSGLLPKSEIKNFVMYKTQRFKESFGHLLNISEENRSPDRRWCLKDTDQEPCTGLLTILTSTLFYKTVNILGFTFYTEQKDNQVLGYYRKDQLDKNGIHAEDKFWEDAKKNGFTSAKVGDIKKKIISDLVDTHRVKLINEEELKGLQL